MRRRAFVTASVSGLASLTGCLGYTVQSSDDVASRKTQIEELEAQVATQREQLTARQERIGSLNETLQSREETLENLQSTATARSETISELREQVDTLVEG